jgi:hypothetical protein
MKEKLANIALEDSAIRQLIDEYETSQAKVKESIIEEL